MRVRVKICCIGSPEEAALALSMGAGALGLVSRMPGGPGPIPEPRIAEIAARVPPGATSVLLTRETDAAAIVGQHARCRTNAIQLVDATAPQTRRTVREALPGIGLIQVVHVRDERALGQAREAAAHCDALLLDSGNPAAGELGGTGRVHDWALSRRIVEAAPIPVFLAGGLNADNVARAVREVRPFGVDVCTGVRTGGRLDEAKLRAFFDALRQD